MKTSFDRISLCASAVAFAALFTGCSVSPDYSNYDWAARGGIVSDDDRNLAAARFEPFAMRNVQNNRDEITPSGAPTPREAELVIDPGNRSGPVIERVPPKKVATR